jgi:hypothetical protein
MKNTNLKHEMTKREVDAGLKGLTRSFDVWKRNNEMGLVRYRCFEDCTSHQFCVQSADFFQKTVSVDRILELEQQIELLLKESPFSRSGSFPTIEEAIAAHDASFESSRLPER